MADPRSSTKALRDNEKRAFNTFAERVKSQEISEGRQPTDREVMRIVRETAEAVERKQISNLYKKR